MTVIIRDIPMGNGGIVVAEPFKDGSPIRDADGGLIICSQRYYDAGARDRAEAHARADMRSVWGYE